MKYIKTFEDLSDNIEINDWIAIKFNFSNYKNILFTTNIPYIITKTIKSASFNVRIIDENNNHIWINESEIAYCSKNKEDVEIYLKTKKYNL